MKKFYLTRFEDVSGVSGTGRVARGIEFDDGSVIMQWNTSHQSIGLYWSMEHLIDIHGHEGRAVIEYTDDEVTVKPLGSSYIDAVHYLTP